jgi:adenosylcobyric acid synthase
LQHRTATPGAATRGSLLVAGTTSDAGKSVVTTGLCRALARTGMRVAPFKAQNMSNNSMVTPDGDEIGRAQWVQAVAARATPEAAMNPVLLKPGDDMRSHIVVMGQPYGQLEAGEFAAGRAALAEAAFSAYDDLRGRFDVVICEGAGSPAEINLRRGDFVNMGLSRHGDIPTVVVGDIDRGGVFASFFGTLALLDESDQRLIVGFVVNKFRGDLGLLRPGLDDIERLTGRPVLGVLPWRRDLWLDSEDSLATAERPRHDGSESGDRLRVAVVVLPRISNVTDVDALCLEPGLDVSFVDSPRALASADLVVLPGTRATIQDLSWLRSRGLADAVVQHSRDGGAVLGICGGFQMLGHEVVDPDGIEGPASTVVPGLGLLDVRTLFAAEKVLRTPRGVAWGVPATGYEIHHGRVEAAGGEPFLDGVRSGSVFGTMWHGSLEGDALRARFLQEIAMLTGHDGFRPGEVSFAAAREQRIDLLADLVEEHLDLSRIVEIIGASPKGLPVLRAGLSR